MGGVFAAGRWNVPWGRLVVEARRGISRPGDGRIETAGMRRRLEELRPPPAESAALGNAAHEVLAFLLLKEGGTVSEMEKVFDTDRRAVVDRLHALGWIEPRGRKGEATVWAIAGPCLAHFGARSAAELKEAIAGQLPQR